MNAAAAAHPSPDATDTPKDLDLAPGPKGLWLLGCALDFLLGEPYDLVYRYTREYGDFLQFKILHRRAVVVNTPELIAPVVEDWHTFHKGVPNPAVQPIVGESIFAGNRPSWSFGREHHPYAQDYASRAFSAMVPAMLEHTREHLGAMAQHSAQPSDLYPPLVRMLYDVFCINVLGRRTDETMFADYSRIIDEVTFRLKTQGITINPWFWRKLERWNAGITRIIADRNQAHSADSGAESLPNDALGFVLRRGTQLSPEQLRDEVSTMLIGGIHPVATALSAALYNLCRYPDEARPVIDEVRRFAASEGGKSPSLEAIMGLGCLDRFVDETMRLSPPVHIISRAVKPGKVARVNGYEVPTGTEVVFSPFAVHRNPDLWPSPLEFRADRFLSPPEPYTYFPFGVGERTCMGQPYAKLCLRAMLFVLLSEFELSVDTSRALENKSGPLIIVPKHPLMGQISPI